MIKKVIVSCIFIVIVTGVLVIPVQSGFLVTNTEGEPFRFFPWDTDQLTIGWRHSVELTPWQETYRVLDNDELSFESSTYQSYGAGTPDTEGDVEFLSNGFIRVTGIERTMPYFSLYYVPISNYYLENDSEKYPMSEFVPDDTKVQIHYKKLLVYQWLWLKIKLF